MKHTMPLVGLMLLATVGAATPAPATSAPSNATIIKAVIGGDDADKKDENVALAIVMSLGAGMLTFTHLHSLTLTTGLATTIGGAAPFFPALVKMNQPKILAGSLGVASGVMVYVSFVEIFVKANDAITLGTGGAGLKLSDTANSDGLYETEKLGFVYPGEKLPNLYTTLTFFGGCLIVMLLHKVVHLLSPESELLEDVDVVAHHDEEVAARAAQAEEQNDTQTPKAETETGNNPSEEMSEVVVSSASEPANGSESNGTPSAPANALFEMSEKKREELRKMGLLTALALGLHNFPEGFATFIATLEDPALGAGLAVAIAIHNIPEGICVAMPVYYATGSKWKALGWAFLSGLSEPIGGILGWVALRSVFTDLVFGIVFGSVGGMMVWIVMSELLPTAYEHDKSGKIVPPCVFAGMVVISASLLAFAFA